MLCEKLDCWLSTAILAISEQWLLLARVLNSFFYFTFLNISAAFDAVSHTILCDLLLSGFGIKFTALKWLQSFLPNWFQNVHVGYGYFSITPCDFVVSQRSLLGPIVFFQYISSNSAVISAQPLLSSVCWQSLLSALFQDELMDKWLSQSWWMTSQIDLLRNVFCWIQWKLRNLYLAHGIWGNEPNTEHCQHQQI